MGATGTTGKCVETAVTTIVIHKKGVQGYAILQALVRAQGILR